MFTSALRNAMSPAKPMSWAEAFVLSTVAIFASLPVFAALYLAKAALGVNLMAGPSPLHDLLFHLVR